MPRELGVLPENVFCYVEFSLEKCWSEKCIVENLSMQFLIEYKWISGLIAKCWNLESPMMKKEIRLDSC